MGVPLLGIGLPVHLSCFLSVRLVLGERLLGEDLLLLGLLKHLSCAPSAPFLMGERLLREDLLFLLGLSIVL